MFFFIESNGMPSASYAFGDGEPREAMPCMASLSKKAKINQG
jgi:hypothetical protein